MELVCLGKGEYATIYLASNGTKAIKVISSDKLDSAIREVSIIKYLSHKNIIDIDTVFYADNYLMFSMKRYANSLRQIIKDMKILNPIVVYKLAADILDAVEYMHSKDIIHCDLKPDNILIDNCTAVIADFGLSVLQGEKYHRARVQTCDYRAPEIDINRTKLIYGERIDMWSVGCILYELATGCKFVTYEPNNEDSTMYAANALNLPKILNKKERVTMLKAAQHLVIRQRIESLLKQKTPHYEIYIRDGLSNLIARCLQPNYIKRIDAKSALSIIKNILLKVNLNYMFSDNYVKKHKIINLQIDETSVLFNVDPILISKLSDHVIDYAQKMYLKLDVDDDQLNLVCIYIASCVISSNIHHISAFIGQKIDKNKMMRLISVVMQKISYVVI
jgi:serine/threonine protein kinase